MSNFVMANAFELYNIFFIDFLKYFRRFPSGKNINLNKIKYPVLLNQ